MRRLQPALTQQRRSDVTNPSRLRTGRGPDRILGHQYGAMVRSTRPRQFAGQRMLVVAGVFAVAVLVVKVLVAIATNPAQLVGALAPLVLLVAPLFLVYRLMLGRRAGAVTRSAFRAGTRISRALLGHGARPSAATSVGDRVRAAIRAGRVVRHIPVRRFQVRPIAGGDSVPCLLCGDLDGAEPRDGDILRLLGRPERSGDFAAQRIEVLGSGGAGPPVRVIRGRLVGPAATALWWSRFCYVASAVVAAWAVATLIDLVMP
jgi:hypothetical protein